MVTLANFISIEFGPENNMVEKKKAMGHENFVNFYSGENFDLENEYIMDFSRLCTKYFFFRLIFDVSCKKKKLYLKAGNDCVRKLYRLLVTTA